MQAISPQLERLADSCRQLGLLLLVGVLCLGNIPFSGMARTYTAARQAEELPAEEHSPSAGAHQLVAHSQRRLRHSLPRAQHVVHVVDAVLRSPAFNASPALPRQEHALRFGLGTPLRI